MKLRATILVPLAMACGSADQTREDVPASTHRAADSTFVIQRPTVVAAYPVTQAQADSSEVIATILDDFQHHLRGVPEKLATEGIDFHESYSPEVALVVNGRRNLRAIDLRDGPTYIFIAPDGADTTVRGVQQFAGIICKARERFGRIPGRPPTPDDGWC